MGWSGSRSEGGESGLESIRDFNGFSLIFTNIPTDFQTTPFDSKLFVFKKTLQNAGNTSNKQIPRFIALAEPVRRRGKCCSWSNFGKNQWNPYYGTIQPYRGLWWDLVGKSIKTHWKTCKIDPEASQVVSNHPECFARSYFIVLCPWGVCRARKPRKPEILHDFFWKKNINPGEYCNLMSSSTFLQYCTGCKS